MTKQTGKPKQQRVRVNVSLNPQYVEQLKLLANESGVTLSGFCANILERYTLQDTKILASDILEIGFNSHAEKTREDVKIALNMQMNRVRTLIAKNSLESAASRQAVGILLKREFGNEKGQEYLDKTWSHAVNYLKNPTPQIKAAISELAAGMGEDDPALLMELRESSKELRQELPNLSKRVTAMEKKQQESIEELISTVKKLQDKLDSNSKQLANATIELDRERREYSQLIEEEKNRKKGFFGR